MISNVDHQQLLVSGEVSRIDLETVTTGIRQAFKLTHDLPLESKEASSTRISDEDNFSDIVAELKYPHVPIQAVQIRSRQPNLLTTNAHRCYQPVAVFFFGMIEISIGAKCSISTSIR